MGTYYTKNSDIELLLSDNIVKLINYREKEKGRVYLFHADRLYQVMKFGAKQKIVPTYGKDICVAITFVTDYHSAGKHITSTNDGINTYIKDEDYRQIMEELEQGLKHELP
ncbi:hypothetical protein ACLHDG_13640 [Sulfurovum sp. CS9]|uniref:hypothetical protein n=1 Tax=Sulfurovum sp. CS9 TaxID=3391146 RepID=UPI0039EC6CA6